MTVIYGTNCITEEAFLAEREIVYTLFFFSSRRRHTRCSRDWSSDVCSSDLGAELGHRFDADRAPGTDLGAEPLGEEPDHRIGLGAPGPVLDSGVHVLDVLAEEIGRASCRERV